MRKVIFLILVAALACDEPDVNVYIDMGGTDGTDDTDTGSAGDADGDGDGDADSDADTDTDTGDGGDADGDGDGDGDGDSDSNSDADSDTDVDADTNTDTDVDADAGIEPVVSYENMIILPDGANPQGLLGASPVQTVESGFGAESVDFSLGGLHGDLPSPGCDCTDAMITNNCIALTVVVGDGEPRGFLWVGAESGVMAGTITTPVTGYGVWTTQNLPYSADMSIYALQSALPATFTETMLAGADPPNIYLSGDFGDIGSSEVRSTQDAFQEARINGWAAHTPDFGDPANSVMAAAFAATWTDVNGSTVRLRGTFKAYFISVTL